MLNVRKLKQDFSSTILKEGKELYDGAKVVSAKILHLDTKTMRINAQVLGQFDNTYTSQIEIDRLECETIDSDCDCPYHYDCQHLAALLFYLEDHLDEILVNYSKEADLGSVQKGPEEEEDRHHELLEAMREAASKEDKRKGEQYQKQLLEEYVAASGVLSASPFFLPQEGVSIDRAELAVLISFAQKQFKNSVELQLAFRLPSRSKPLYIPSIRDLLEGMRYAEPVVIGGKSYFFTLDSFDPSQRELVKMILDFARIVDKSPNEKGTKSAFVEMKVFGMILAKAFDIASERLLKHGSGFQEEDFPSLPCLYEESLEAPLRFSLTPAAIRLNLEYIKPPTSKILLNPSLVVDKNRLTLEEVRLFECGKPGVIVNQIYYRFPVEITRQHLSRLSGLRDLTIPEPLFGTFIENALPQLASYAEVIDEGVVDAFVTLPYTGKFEAVCEISYLNGELEAEISFRYDGEAIPAAASKLTYDQVNSFVTKQGVVARNLVEEKKIIDSLFQDFYYLPEQGVYVAKTEKKIIEFMTDTIPKFQEIVSFNCPQNLLDQFIYDETSFEITLSHTDRMDVYELKMQVNGALQGLRMDHLWDCILSRRAYLELDQKRGKQKKPSTGKLPKILVLDLDRIGAIVQLFDELGIQKIDNHTLERPLWSIANIDASQFEGLPVTFTISEELGEIRKQMLGETSFASTAIPKEIAADLRPYQAEGVRWLERLRLMYLSGILADDMGLGKTLQAIVALSQIKKKIKAPSLIVCPTSLLYNWKEEIAKFNSQLKAIVVDGVPHNRKKLIDSVGEYDVIITSYSLIQKDIELYEPIHFGYAILDEAQHIKNRTTRNAKSVKMIKARHRLILSGTPIENSLEELWSLFDYLMPGFLGTFERFLEKYIRVSGKEQTRNLEYLKKKVAPFILRRMKADVLDDLPPVSEIVYHTQLTPTQEELYRSYAASARDELVRLVEKEGFDKVQIHVLATLTRLKQICCHPAIFAKEQVEAGDCAKYDMLIELLQTLIEGRHKTVIFSQYTRMLQIMREDFEQLGIRFLYLDGSSKNRLDLVKQFNEDETISVFLVSLKAGGTGLNLVGADTVIHYDMWWNPAVENQATDRVYRLGQKRSVSVFKLVTKNTIEEKIVEMQRKKQGIVKKVVSSDDEIISKLTWEDVLQLLT